MSDVRVSDSDSPARITRASYQEKRLAFVRQFLAHRKLRGLEIGACDLPTIPKTHGDCEFADFRSAEEMVQLWNLPPESVMPVKYVIKRQHALDSQVDERFDYVIACHVIEHVPNPIGYLLELSRLLDPLGPRLIFIAVPDKRRTLDEHRQSTTLEHLLSDFYQDCRYPSIEHILEFSKHWLQEIRKMSEVSTMSYYQWGVGNHRSGIADAHCHVWTDEDFFAQIRQLTGNDGLLSNMKILARQSTPIGYNEFMIALHVTVSDSAQLPTPVSAG